MKALYVAAIVLLLLIFKGHITKRKHRCPKCGFVFEPDFYQRMLSNGYMGSKRYLKCPFCHKKSYCSPVD